MHKYGQSDPGAKILTNHRVQQLTLTKIAIENKITSGVRPIFVPGGVIWT